MVARLEAEGAAAAAGTATTAVTMAAPVKASAGTATLSRVMAAQGALGPEAEVDAEEMAVAAAAGVARVAAVDALDLLRGRRVGTTEAAGLEAEVAVAVGSVARALELAAVPAAVARLVKTRAVEDLCQFEAAMDCQ